jgi:5,10-methenyltetrahydrofolate synthetase
MTKAELRAIYMDKRRSLSPGDVAAASGRIAERFFNEIDLAGVRKLHIFIRIPKFNEIDTSNIYFRLWQERRNIATFAPRSDLVSGEITSIEFDSDTPFAENKWEIREPLGNEKAEPDEFDLVLVPLLCVDESGQRIGYGKGFYDRFLSRCRSDCLKVGLSYFPPVLAVDAIDAHDVKLDLCITPERTFRFGPVSSYLN